MAKVVHLGYDRSTGHLWHDTDAGGKHLAVKRCCCTFNSNGLRCCYSGSARPTSVTFTQRKCYYSDSGCTTNIAPPASRTGSYIKMNNDVALNASDWEWYTYSDGANCSCWVTKAKHALIYWEVQPGDGSDCPATQGSTASGYPLVDDDVYIALRSSSTGAWFFSHSTVSQAAACSAGAAFSYNGLEATPTIIDSCCGGSMDVETACISDASNYYKIETVGVLAFTNNTCCQCDSALPPTALFCTPTSDGSEAECDGNGLNSCTNDQDEDCP